MKTVLTLLVILVLTGCCNGSGPGPRAMLEREMIDTTGPDRQLAG